MGQLRDRYRQAIELQQMGYSYEEIAAILGRTEGMVRTDLSRARAELSECLEKQGITE
jgi:RNA polymerase sigma factor (sigma-70 family)